MHLCIYQLLHSTPKCHVLFLKHLEANCFATQLPWHLWSGCWAHNTLLYKTGRFSSFHWPLWEVIGFVRLKLEVSLYSIKVSSMYNCVQGIAIPKTFFGRLFFVKSFTALWSIALRLESLSCPSLVLETNRKKPYWNMFRIWMEWLQQILDLTS